MLLASYSSRLGHNFDLSNPKILDKERNLEKKINFRKNRTFKQQKLTKGLSDMVRFYNIHQNF